MSVDDTLNIIIKYNNKYNKGSLVNSRLRGELTNRYANYLTKYKNYVIIKEKTRKENEMV